MPLRIVLADDHQMFRQGIKALLVQPEFAVVGEASDGRETVRLARDLRPDVVVLDIGMPMLNGIDAAREVVRVSPGTKTILLTMHHEDHYVIAALRAGVTGYVLKTQASTDLVQAIREVSHRRVYLSPGVSRTVVEAYLSKTDLPADPLSARERQVLQLVAAGKTTKEVAHILGISVKTADSHRSRAMSKLDIHETASLVRYAIRHGLVEP